MPRNQRDDSLIIRSGGNNDILIDSAHTIANATATVTISNVAPAGVGTATISKWLAFEDETGTTYYIPMWT